MLSRPETAENDKNFHLGVELLCYDVVMLLILKSKLKSCNTSHSFRYMEFNEFSFIPLFFRSYSRYEHESL